MQVSYYILSLCLTQVHIIRKSAERFFSMFQSKSNPRMVLIIWKFMNDKGFSIICRNIVPLIIIYWFWSFVSDFFCTKTVHITYKLLVLFTCEKIFGVCSFRIFRKSNSDFKTSVHTTQKSNNCSSYWFFFLFS